MRNSSAPWTFCCWEEINQNNYPGIEIASDDVNRYVAKRFKLIAIFQGDQLIVVNEFNGAGQGVHSEIMNRLLIIELKKQATQIFNR